MGRSLLDVAEEHAGVEGGGDEGVTESVGSDAFGDPGLAGGAADDAAGLAGITWHSLRHYHALTLLSAGVSPALVAERLGHDIQTLMRTYAHVIRSDDDRVRAVIDEQLGVSAEDFRRSGGPEAVPHIGPDLRKPFETTSTPRNEPADSGACDDDPS